MRFAIAAGILAQTLPVASEMENSVLLLSQAERRQQIQALLQEPTSGRDSMKKTHKKGDGGSLFSSFGFQGRREGLLKNKMKKSVVGCDPTASDADADADLGVLSCGMGQYCMESQDSELGGVCFDRRVEELQLDDDDCYCDVPYNAGLLCNATYAGFGDFDCDCDEFNTTTGIGTIECIYEDYCFSDIGCNSTCGIIEYGIEVYPDGNHSATTVCYNISIPYEQQVCFASSDYVESYTCSFNGVECDSCLEIYYSYETSVSSANSTYNKTITVSCIEFDCTNTAGGHSGSMCGQGDYSIAPILDICLDPNATYLPTLPPVPEIPAPTPAPESPAPTPVVSSTPEAPTPAEGSVAPSAEEGLGKTSAPTMESGVSGLLSTEGAMSLFGLSVAMIAYFAG